MHPGNGQTTLANTRRIWAALSADPRCGKYKLARDLGISPNTLYGALRRLERAGYIQRGAGDNAYVVLVPFIVTGKESE